MRWLMQVVPVLAVVVLDDYQADSLGPVGGTVAVFGLLLTIVFVWSAFLRGNVLVRRREDRPDDARLHDRPDDAWLHAKSDAQLHDRSDARLYSRFGDRSGGTARLAR
ncbi:hypothetical protein AB0I81_45150 [Nonomuraea sp. NPDC050404]|uniref:hypothetical protein n=1 Tax=Nonomuraea sp. NPDC050404 TaxID=3155783 RepID=UPI0033C00902